MRKKIEWIWEEIENLNEGRLQTLRAKVIGGWLVNSIIQDLRLKVLSNSLTFIPDRDHEWTIIAPIIEEKPPAKVAASDFENPKK